jgi:late competence protein required for DNA uptake (superfamily II DNA/RNA helicase)
MGKVFKLIVNQKKQVKKAKNNNYSNYHNHNNNERKNICHSCKSQVSEYETFYFLNTAYCDLCYVILAYTL